MDNILWICGRLIGEWDAAGTIWSFQGVFTNRDLAIAACKDETYFIFSSEIDMQLCHDNTFPPDGYYPVIEAELEKGNE